MQSKKIRVGIIGVGWGSLVHTPAYRAVDNFEVVAICGRRSQRATSAGERLGISDISTDWESFVKRDDLDLISIASPVDEHIKMSMAALEAGKHVLCEKPLSLDACEANDLLQAAEQSNKASAICHELRWLPHNLAIWDAVESGIIGNPYFIRVAQSAGYWHPNHAAQSEWMYQRHQGGGYLMGQQTHEIDFIMKLFGAPVAVFADLQTNIKKRKMPDGRIIDVDADDTGTIIMRLESGASILLSSSVMGVHSSGKTIDIFGDNGTITMASDGALQAGKVSDDGLKPLAISNRQPVSGVDLGSKRSAGMVRAMALMLEDWLPAFEGKPAPRVPSIREGYITQKIVDAAYRSSDGAGWITIEK